MVAGLDAFLGRKGDGEPGTNSLWIGLQRLDDITWGRHTFSASPKTSYNSALLVLRVTMSSRRRYPPAGRTARAEAQSSNIGVDLLTLLFAMCSCFINLPSSGGRMSSAPSGR